MLKAIARYPRLFAMGLMAPALAPVSAWPQDATPAAPTLALEDDAQDRLGRKACAVALCSTLHNKRPQTGDVGCTVRKTWRKEILTGLLAKGGLSWPWGNARCLTQLKLDRAQLIKAMSDGEYEAQLEKHDVRCQLERDSKTDEVTFEIRPRVTFKQGKAVKAHMNWGKIVAPTLAKGALWSATAADNAFGVLQSVIVDDINHFIETKCLEVKGEWEGQ
jgi:hypothetical protein